jgi:Domain of unknown function (DUF4159)
MRLLKRIAIGISAALLVCSFLAIEAHGFQYFGDPRLNSQYENANADEKAEFYWSRLRYNSAYGGGGRRFGDDFGGYGGFGRYGGAWSRDYPKADRQFLMAMKRLTNVNTRSMEQVVDIDSPDTDPHSLDNYPWVYAVQAQDWTFNAEEAKRMHDYLMKGGFLMVDDFHGTEDWENFMQGLRQFLPNAQVEDLNDNDEIFHVLFDLSQRFQVPGEQYVWSGRTYEKDGYVAKWRGVRDDKGRIIVAICFNMHLGDAWEWADDPRYPEKFASLAFRVGLNYIVYGMTH